MKINKLIIACIVLLFSSYLAKAQTDEIGKIALAVVMPENVEGLNTSQLSKLESKIIQVATNAGLSASGYNRNFVIYPKFAIYETNVVEGGMQNITVITTELSLYIKQVSNNMLFSSVSKSLKGSGKTKELAITNAISQIPVSDKDFESFMEKGKLKIFQYYEANCDDIIKKADLYIKTQGYGQAFGLLMSVPEEVPCYDKVVAKAIETYKAYQNQHCMELLQQAKAKVAVMDYDEALAILAKIDPSSNCYKEQQTLLKSTESKVSEEVRKQENLQMKLYNDAVSLEKQRINAIKEIAVEYYKSQPQTINYNVLVNNSSL